MARRRSGGRWLLGLGFLAAGAAVVWAFWPKGQPNAEKTPTPDGTIEIIQVAPADRSTDGEARPGPTDQPTQTGEQEDPAATTPAPPPISASEARALYERGAELHEARDLVAARSKLSEAYFSGNLPPHQQADARAKLTELAEITLIGRGSSVYPNDPYAGYYTCQTGDSLGAIERKLKLHVPWRLLLTVNNMYRPEDLAAGRRYKVVYGPFHAVIDKSDFTMDLYLLREGLARVFIKRVAIGTGKNGTTPDGMWRVKLGGKHERPTWYPPPNSKYRGPIPYGNDDYAFGAKGLWIGLEGIDRATKPLTDYGLHSTSKPDSIGKAESLGCIRLADDDIDLAYRLLYEHWSTVAVRP